MTHSSHFFDKNLVQTMAPSILINVRVRVIVVFTR